MKTFNELRLINVNEHTEKKGKFTYPMTDETSIGTSTFNSEGKIIKLVSKEVVFEEVNYYNIMTEKNINLFANDILTSSRFNNMYPIENMKFVKNDDKKLITRDELKNVSDKYYYGLRLSEQNLTIRQIETHIANLKKMEVKLNTKLELV